MICSTCRQAVDRLIRREWCNSCYCRGLREGTIQRIQNRPYRLTDWVEDLQLIYNTRQHVITKAQFAVAMKMNKKAFDRALVRARRAGLLSAEIVFPKSL